MLALGEQLRVMLQCGSDTLTMSVPRHVAQRHALSEGQTLQVRLRGELIHLMPATHAQG